MEEIKLLMLLKKGHPKAFHHLYDKYWKQLYLKAYSRMGDEEAAKDIVQEIFIDFWNRHHTIDIQLNLQSYLLGSVKQQVFNFYRKERVKEKILDEAIERMESLTETIDQLLDREQMEQILDHAIQQLPSHMQRTFILRCNNLSIKEIANKLNIAEQTVSNNLYECVKSLRHYFLKNNRSNDSFLYWLFLFAMLNN